MWLTTNQLKRTGQSKPPSFFINFQEKSSKKKVKVVLLSFSITDKTRTFKFADPAQGQGAGIFFKALLHLIGRVHSKQTTRQSIVKPMRYYVISEITSNRFCLPRMVSTFSSKICSLYFALIRFLEISNIFFTFCSRARYGVWKNLFTMVFFILLFLENNRSLVYL